MTSQLSEPVARQVSTGQIMRMAARTSEELVHRPPTDLQPARMRPFKAADPCRPVGLSKALSRAEIVALISQASNLMTVSSARIEVRQATPQPVASSGLPY